MESKRYLEVGDTVYVLQEKAKVYDLVDKNSSLIKVEFLEGPAQGLVQLVVLKQVEKD
jgi:hypothetical protein